MKATQQSIKTAPQPTEHPYEWEYVPQVDITTDELAQLAPILAKMSKDPHAAERDIEKLYSLPPGSSLARHFRQKQHQ